MKAKYHVDLEEIPRPKKHEEVIYNHICKSKDGLMNTELVKLTGFGSRRIREVTLYLKTIKKIKVKYCRCNHSPIYYKL
tara:strand:- start:10465 stop:10701 length:237 start_codon:yes stop_codon:yes gene_type:complete